MVIAELSICGLTKEVTYLVSILIDSVPHVITDYTKTQPSLAPTSRKIQIFRNPRREAGVIRLNYLYATRND